jgi:hypothetical protein
MKDGAGEVASRFCWWGKSPKIGWEKSLANAENVCWFRKP